MHEQYRGLKFIMLKRYGTHAKPPILLIHGGAGLYKDNQELLERRKNTIAEIIPLLTRVVKQLRKYPHPLNNSGRISASAGGVLLPFVCPLL